MILGVVVGVLPLYLLDDELRPFVVALLAFGSLASLVWLKPPKQTDSAFAAGAAGGAANTYAGVGGPIIAAFVARQGWKREDYLRTQQVIFGMLNLASIPLLHLPAITPWQLIVAVALLPIGVIAGLGLRKLMSQPTAMKVSEAVIVIVVAVALVRSIVVLSA